MGLGLEIYEKYDKLVRWKLMEYVYPAGGRGAVSKWRLKDVAIGLPQAFMDKFLKDLVKRTVWKPPDIEALTGKKYSGLSELRWRCGRPHRIIGYASRLPDNDRPLGERHGIFVMLIGCKHDGKKYYPTESLDTAVKRKKEIDDRKAAIDEYRLPFDSGTEGPKVP